MGGLRRSATLLLAVAISLSVPFPTGATLTFSRPTDLLGLVSTFEEGTGLPARNFTLSVTARSGSGKGDMFWMVRASSALYVLVNVATGGFPDVGFDYSSNVFDQSAIFSTEEMIMTMRTYTFAYTDIDNITASLSLYIDAEHIGTRQIAPIFPGRSVFGPDSIPLLTFGPYANFQYDEEGELYVTRLGDLDGLYGQFDGVQLWDRALNASEVVEMAAAPSSLTGDEAGLCVFLHADRGYGSRIPNRGSAGAAYDGLLGAYGVGPGPTSAFFGTGCGAEPATSPSCENRTGGTNTAPIADDGAQTVGVFVLVYVDHVRCGDRPKRPWRGQW